MIQLQHSDAVSDSADQDELRRREQLLQAAMDSLSPHRRKVFELVKIQRLSYEDTARTLNISINTVKVHMNQALTHIRDFILDSL